jgi:hypothetical protein
MPSVSKKQHNLMALVANNPKAAKRLGIPKSVGEDFMKADKGKKFKEGGMAKHEDVKMDKKVVKKAVGMHDKQMHGGKKTNLEGLKKGGCVKKYAEGGTVASDKKPAESAYDKRIREEALQEMRDKKMREKMGTAYDKARENSLGAPEKKMRKGGMCGTKKYARGGGIEVRGKTKGRMI